MNRPYNQRAVLKGGSFFLFVRFLTAFGMTYTIDEWGKARVRAEKPEPAPLFFTLDFLSFRTQ